MRNVYLYGRLAKLFGKSFRFDTATAGETMRALNCAFPGKFVAAMREGSYQIVRGRRHGGMNLDLDLICKFKLGSADLHIIPVASGGKNSTGTIKAVTGVALVGAAIFMSGGTLAAPLGALGSSLGMSYGTIAALGLGVALAGASTLMAKPEASKSNSDSFNFGGPINTNEQGNCVPLVYGEVICGGQPISAGFDVEDIAVYQS